jgi:hypothetical protein
MVFYLLLCRRPWSFIVSTRPQARLWRMTSFAQSKPSSLFTSVRSRKWWRRTVLQAGYRFRSITILRTYRDARLQSPRPVSAVRVPQCIAIWQRLFYSTELPPFVTNITVVSSVVMTSSTAIRHSYKQRCSKWKLTIADVSFKSETRAVRQKNGNMLMVMLDVHNCRY